MEDNGLFLFISIAFLGLGPLLYGAARSQKIYLSALDGFLFAAIGGLVLVDVLPSAVRQSGWGVLGFALVGFLGPSAVERSFRRAARQAHRVAMVLGLISLGFHALTDGAALVGGAAVGSHQALPLAVVLHRIPVGLTIWWLLRPAFGTRVAGGALVLVAASTLLGFQLGGEILSALSTTAFGFFQALVAGSLLHVVVHRSEFRGAGEAPAERFARRRMAGAGSIVGLLLALFVMSREPLMSAPAAVEMKEAFLQLALASAPALLLAYILAGLLSAFVPMASIRWMNRGSGWMRSLRGMAVGLPLPVCSCGVVPLFQSLSRQGASASAAIAFLVATPELSLDALLLSLPLLGPEMTVLRLIAAACVALLTGWLVGAAMKNGAAVNLPIFQPDAPQQPVAARLKAGYAAGMEVVDSTAPWILLGLAVAAALQPALQTGWLEAVPGLLEVPIFALLGLPVYVCASGATPLVAVLLAKGVSPGAALAFLLTGPATNVTTFGVVSGVLGRRAAIIFGASAAFFSVALGYLANWAFPVIQPPALSGGPASETVGQFQLACLGLLALLFLFSLIRQGPRGFVGQVLSLDEAGA